MDQLIDTVPWQPIGPRIENYRLLLLQYYTSHPDWYSLGSNLINLVLHLPTTA